MLAITSSERPFAGRFAGLFCSRVGACRAVTAMMRSVSVVDGQRNASVKFPMVPDKVP